MAEPWLRGTLTGVDPLRRQVLHALELSGEDAERWCFVLSDMQINERPCGAASVAYHLRHIARSLDRLLSYAEGKQLSEEQLTALKTELDEQASSTRVFAEFRAAMSMANLRVLAVDPATYESPRAVGRERLPTTVGSLLVHVAEHTQRHIGQAITTAQIVVRRC